MATFDTEKTWGLPWHVEVPNFEKTPKWFPTEVPEKTRLVVRDVLKSAAQIS